MTKRSEKDEKNKDDGFENHLRGYLGFVGFFLVINLVTSPGRWWFYWPVMMWGIFLLFHAFGTYGPYAPVAIVNIIRNWFSTYKSQVPPLVNSRRQPGAAPAAAPAPPPEPRRRPRGRSPARG